MPRFGRQGDSDGIGRSGDQREGLGEESQADCRGDGKDSRKQYRQISKRSIWTRSRQPPSFSIPWIWSEPSPKKRRWSKSISASGPEKRRRSKRLKCSLRIYSYNGKRYDLSPVGRLKLNKKLGLDLALEQRTLTAQDIVEVIRYLVNLKMGKGEIDDIDHLGNRRVRSVGELLENQFGWAWCAWSAALRNV